MVVAARARCASRARSSSRAITRLTIRSTSAGAIPDPSRMVTSLFMRSMCSGMASLLPQQPLVSHLEGLDGEGVAAGRELRADPLDRKRVDELELDQVVAARRVVDEDRGV